mgnify:CR=1 FL=1
MKNIGIPIGSNHYTTGKNLSQKEIIMAEVNENVEYTKISISKKWKDVIKTICKDTGLKMYHFEDKAVETFIATNYPQYLEEKE